MSLENILQKISEEAQAEVNKIIDEIKAKAEEIKEKLEAAKLQWAWFNSSLNFSLDEHFPLIILDASEKKLQLMERVTEMYQDISEGN